MSLYVNDRHSNSQFCQKKTIWGENMGRIGGLMGNYPSMYSPFLSPHYLMFFYIYIYIQGHDNKFIETIFCILYFLFSTK